MNRHEIERLLPEVIQRTVAEGTPLALILDVMENIHAPSEMILENLDHYFNPYLTKENFVPFLAMWVDLTDILRETPQAFKESQTKGTHSAPLATGLGRLRELVAAAAFLSQWRGTQKGLLRFLETATGVSGFQIDEHIIENGQEKPYHLHIKAPKTSEPFSPLLEKIIDLEKPAYVTYQLDFA
jgi:phage tail-like protein